MRYLHVVIIMLILTGTSVWADKTVAPGSRYNFLVVIPDQASLQEQTAANELVFHLEKATGNIISSAREGSDENIRPDVKIIYVGNTQCARQNGIDFQAFGREEWMLKALDQNTLLLGGGFLRGTLYSVFEFLEQELHVVWADESFTYIPAKPDYAWKFPLEVRGKPSFEFRGTYAYFKHDKQKRILFMLRNRENLFTSDDQTPLDFEKYGIFRTYGSPRSGAHTFYFYTKDWDKDEEDCLALSNDGKRPKAESPRGPGQVCFTNPRTRDLFEAKLRQYITKDREGIDNPLKFPRIYMISHNDNSNICLCPACKAFTENNGASALLMDFINDLARRIADDFPDVFIQTSAYSFAAKPPVKQLKKERNVIAQYAAMGSEFARGNPTLLENKYLSDSMRSLWHPDNAIRFKDISTWHQSCNLAIWDYWILYEDRRPYPTVFASALAENIRTYQKLGAIGLMAECERPLLTSFYALRLWLGYRFLNHTELNSDTEIDRFMNAYYGQGAEVMRKILDYMQLRQDSFPGRIGGVWAHRREDFDDAYFKTVNGYFDEAEKKAADDPASLMRIGYERVHVDILELDRARRLQRLSGLPLEETVSRLAKNHSALAGAYLNPQKAGNEQNGINYYIAGFKAKKIQPPDFLKGQEIVADISWPLFQQHYWGILTPDSEAAGGICLKASSLTTHKRGIQFGFYCEMQKKQFQSDFEKKTAADEKYHYYKFAKVYLSESCYVWAHWTWTLQVDLSPFVDSVPKNTPVDIYLSMKVEGPDYFENSSKENAISIDRVIIVKNAE